MDKAALCLCLPRWAWGQTLAWAGLVRLPCAWFHCYRAGMCLHATETQATSPASHIQPRVWLTRVPSLQTTAFCFLCWSVIKIFSRWFIFSFSRGFSEQSKNSGDKRVGENNSVNQPGWIYHRGWIWITIMISVWTTRGNHIN